MPATSGYWPLEPEHRRLAARWLATIQLHAGEFVRTSALPDRGPRHYLVHLLNAREEIERHLRRPSAAADGPLVLEDLLSKLDMLESRWREVAAFCDTLPRTLVHGDLVPKNMRILRDGRSIGLAVFDWETAGLGVQAPDLAQLLEPQRSWYARRKPIEADRSFLREPLPRHLPLRAGRLCAGAGRRDGRAIGRGRKRVPVPCRHRLDLLAGHRRAGIRWTTSASTRGGSATPCRSPDGAPRARRVLEPT